MNQSSPKIAFIGGGNMAEAILSGLIAKKTLNPSEILVSEPRDERRAELENKYSVSTTSDNAEAIQKTQTVVLAIKPQMLTRVQDALRPHFTSKHTIISILAGASRAKLIRALGDLPQIVRVMPNLPAQVGCGVSAITFPDEMIDADRNWVRTVLQSAGTVVEVEEHLQDVVTAVSGSGPGYIFYLAHCFIEAAVKEGLDHSTAVSLVHQTLAGSAEVLKNSDESAGQLAAKVATPGGTTEAGLSALKEIDLAAIMQRTVKQAADRSRELN